MAEQPFQTADQRLSEAAVELLGQWYDWWLWTDEAPPKMPAALHVRTALFLAQHGRLPD